MAWPRLFVLCLLSVPALQLLPTLAVADVFDLQSLQTEVLKTIDRVRPAVVNISGRGSGFSGVIVSAEGHVLSAGHAVSPGARYRLTLPDGRQLRGIGKGSNPRTDAALIQISDPPADLPYVSMGDSAALVTNQPCFGLSYPGGPKASNEPVARFGRVVRSRSSRGMLQSSVLMEPGDSGGPLFDLNGCVIGIHSRIGRSMDRNYEVPIDVFRACWNELNRERTFTETGLPQPQLGVRFERANPEQEAQQLTVAAVIDGSLASRAAIQPNDTLLQLYGRSLQSVTDLQEALVAARDEGAESIVAEVQRGEETLEISIAFDVEREAAPEVALPSNDHPQVPLPSGYPELQGLAGQVADLEDRLDEACVTIQSTFGDETRSIGGTRVQETCWILSKSSAVGAQPTSQVDGAEVDLVIVARDADHDLVLLKAPETHSSGIVIQTTLPDLPMGTFVLTPDQDGSGILSVVGSPAFPSPKNESRGYLGVMPSTFGENEGARLEQVTEQGAAERAGLLVGDIITKLNDRVIRSQNELRGFLAELDPGAVITATLRRDTEEMTRTVTLDAVPQTSNHAADQMAKSRRRDGFQAIFPHDADLNPDDCGGPLCDLEGRFLGLNIARHSRTRSFAIPASVILEFLEDAVEHEAEGTAAP
jgi:serine protease Do